MIPKPFLLAISLNLLVASCHDNFKKESFEEASDELAEFINEQFLEQNLSFFPKRSYKNIEVKKLEENLTKITVNIKEVEKLSAFRAFNRYNDLIGNMFYDYNIDSFGLEFIPYERRAYYNKRYFGISISVKGVLSDNSEQNCTTAKIVLTNYTPWVEKNIKCRSKK